MTAINVRANVGRFNLCNSKEESASISVTIPALGEKSIWFTVETDKGGRSPDAGEPWSEYLTAMCGQYIENTWVSTGLADVKRLNEWLSEEANAAAVDAVWAELEAAECDHQQAALDKRRARAAAIAVACVEALSTKAEG